MLYLGRVVHRCTSLNVVPWPGGTPLYQFECCTMAGWYTDVPGMNVVPMVGWYTDVPGRMLYHGWVVHRPTRSNVVPWLGGTPTYQVKCCTMAGWYTDVPGRMLYHGWVVHQHTRSNVVPWLGGTPTYEVECCTMVRWYTDVPV